MEAHEISDEWQVLAIACLIRVYECSCNNVAKFVNIAHVNATHIWIERKSPPQGSVCLLLRSQSAHKVLVVERCDDERMMRKTGFLDYPINLGLAGKVGNMELAAANGFDVRQCGPDEVVNTSILRGADRRRCLSQTSKPLAAASSMF